ncbi:MAG: DJ-1/PfpI family protein [Ilumatobacteraceae bacterium]
MQVALALSPGVSADECEAFTVVFDQLEVELVGVGAQLGPVQGQGGGHHVDKRFEDVPAPTIVVVPGGLGCARTALDEPLLEWLREVAPRCEWMVASSTGTVVVAAAGLLDHHEAATHWLASPLLESYGSSASADRVVQVGRIITCEGQITAMHVALMVTLRVFGPAAVQRVRDGMADAAEPKAASRPRWQDTWRGGWSQHRGRSRHARPAPGPRRPRNPELTAPDVIEFDQPTTRGRAPGP